MSQQVQRHTIELPAATGSLTAQEKIEQTLREISDPGPSAAELELGMATIAMTLEAQLGGMLEAAQESGELDEFVVAMTRWFAAHLSDSRGLLLIVHVPTRAIPTGKCVHLMEQAAKAAHEAKPPW